MIDHATKNQIIFRSDRASGKDEAPHEVNLYLVGP
jgi:hypothetical protein